MSRRAGPTEPILEEHRLALWEAFKRSRMNYDTLATLIAKQNPGITPPHPLTLKRIIDPNDAHRSNASGLLDELDRALGVSGKPYRVTFRREEIELLDAWRAIAFVEPAGAAAILRDVVAKGAKAARIEQERQELAQDISVPLHDPSK